MVPVKLRKVYELQLIIPKACKDKIYLLCLKNGFVYRWNPNEEVIAQEADTTNITMLLTSENITDGAARSLKREIEKIVKTYKNALDLS